jgi:nicotinamidase-related amidase
MMFTAAGAAQRGYNVVMPLDAIGAETDFIRLANAWVLTNAPLISRAITLTRSDLVTYGAP